MLMTLANSFMTASRMDGFSYAAPARPASGTARRRLSVTARFAAWLRRLVG